MRKQRNVKVEQARELSKIGTWFDNPRYEPTNPLAHFDKVLLMPKIFQAKYSILWCPEGLHPENSDLEYCTVEEI